MNNDISTQLAPTGVLRAGINLSNFLLVTGRTSKGAPEGVAPDIAAEIAARLGVPVKYVTFEGPGQLADEAGKNVWDIGLIGAEAQRAETIAFTSAYAEIEATYLVPADSSVLSIEEVDQPAMEISVAQRAAYGLWLELNLSHATLVPADSIDNSLSNFKTQKLDALAGLRPRLLKDQKKLPGSRILDGHFTTVQQAVGTAKANTAGAEFLQQVVSELVSSGFVAQRIAHHGVAGLSVAADK